MSDARKGIIQRISSKLSHEQWLILALTTLVIIILSLSGALLYTLNWSKLAIATSVFFLCYPLIWCAWRSYHFWRDTIMQLTTYTQILGEGETNLRFKPQHQDNLLAELQREIAQLASSHSAKQNQAQTMESLLSHILDSWPIPVCLFDENNLLRYRNSAMKEHMQQPMLLGTSATDLGFQLTNDKLSHTHFAHQWQCQSISYLFQGKRCHIFSALNISKPLNQQQSTTQANLIRVLAHELRNSLTPMASMADTLLSTQNYNQHQVELVLNRIQQRSNRLLSFIEQYSQLSQLPTPKCTWFNFSDLIEEAKAMTLDKCQVNIQGNNQCYGDNQQLAQIFINLFKNAQEACTQDTCIIDVSIYYQNNEQVIEVTDNGPGFANLDNALTPFYTTKSQGSGIGLSLCAEITRNHGGELKLINLAKQGAKITMTWPIDSHAKS